MQTKPDRQLAAVRQRRGMTQAKLSQETNIRQDRISKIENSHANPTYQEAGAFAKALASTRQELFPDIVWRLQKAATKWSGIEKVRGGAEIGA